MPTIDERAETYKTIFGKYPPGYKPYGQKLKDMKDKLLFQAVQGQELTPADSAVAKNLGVLPGPNDRMMTQKERSAARIQKQDWLPDDPQQNLYGWQGSVQASQDSIDVDLKSKSIDSLQDTARRMNYTDQIRKLNAIRKFQEKGWDALNEEEKRIVSGIDKSKKEKSNEEKLADYLKKAKQAGDITTATYTGIDEETGKEKEFYKYPSLVDQAKITTEAMKDSVALTNKAVQWGVPVDKLRNIYTQAKQEIDDALLSAPVSGPKEREELARQIAEKYGMSLEAVYEIDDIIEQGK